MKPLVLNSTYESRKSAVLYSSNNNNSINGKLQLCVTFGFTVCVAQLSDEYIQENHNNHGHVGEDN